ncbi:hypothetical protein RHDC4_00944 [Rhodocyclaceae bacterium]|nr:hypothetical protein RHDC4_00944 [Rhodocyclaceae bacterium]
MKLAIMQPYFLPYAGYFQLIAAADVFVVYDNVKYTKKGWINRNRYLRDGSAAAFTLPLRNDPDSLSIADRRIADDFDPARLLNRLREAYRKAPGFEATLPLLESLLLDEERRLFPFLHNSIRKICGHLGLGTPLVVSSSIPVDTDLRGKDRVLAICRHYGATTYVNAIGGQGLYRDEDFAARGIQLRFLKSRFLEYTQFAADFVPWLSIVDVLMFNSIDRTRSYLESGYELIRNESAR